MADGDPFGFCENLEAPAYRARKAVRKLVSLSAPGDGGHALKPAARFTPVDPYVSKFLVRLWRTDRDPDGLAEHLLAPAFRQEGRTELRLPYASSLHGLRHPTMLEKLDLHPGHPMAWMDHPEHSHAHELIDVWTEIPGESIGQGLQLGGYAEHEDWAEDPSAAAGREAARAVARGELPAPGTDVRPEDWVCLAQWMHGLDGSEMDLYSWSIARQDLAAGRFDRVYATMTWNP